MKVVILAGGLGTRLAEETIVKPKPMVEIGGKPILWHIMSIYAAYGYNEFIIALGYKGEFIRNYFLNYHCLNSDFSVSLGNGDVNICNRSDVENWKVHLIDTGQYTQTGGRLKRLQKLIGDETFMVTYGDGVADIDIKKLVNFHKQYGRIVTITSVQEPNRFGYIQASNNLVTDFTEKSQTENGRINGGFFVLEPGIFDYIDDDNVQFEKEPLERLVRNEQLAVYQHNNFWQCMDTIRDVHFLNDLWADDIAPWRELNE